MLYRSHRCFAVSISSVPSQARLMQISVIASRIARVITRASEWLGSTAETLTSTGKFGM